MNSSTHIFITLAGQTISDDFYDCWKVVCRKFVFRENVSAPLFFFFRQRLMDEMRFDWIYRELNSAHFFISRELFHWWRKNVFPRIFFRIVSIVALARPHSSDAFRASHWSVSNSSTFRLVNFQSHRLFEHRLFEHRLFEHRLFSWVDLDDKNTAEYSP